MIGRHAIGHNFETAYPIFTKLKQGTYYHAISLQVLFQIKPCIFNAAAVTSLAETLSITSNHSSSLHETEGADSLS